MNFEVGHGANPPLERQAGEGVPRPPRLDLVDPLARRHRPAERHAFNAAMSAALEAAIDRLDSTDGVWAAVLAAAPTPGRPVFCAGADLKAIDAGETRGIHTKRGGFAGIVFRERVKPIVAAVDGVATAGQVEE